MLKLKEGSIAPDFELLDDEGKKAKLSDFKGKKVIVYFYPKDDTSGCTAEACSFRDNFLGFKKLKVEILGISNDDVKSHEKFKKKYGLNFRLLADVDKKVVNQYGVYQLKKFMGREHYGIVRTTFLIDERGNIMKIFEKVNPDKHIDEVMEALNA